MNSIPPRLAPGNRLHRRTRARLTPEAPEPLESRIAPASAYVWNGSISDDWFVPQNWTPNGVPGVNDSATLSIASTINLTSPATVVDFTQTAGTLTGSGILNISSYFHWSGGTEAGTGSTQVQPGSLLDISSAATKTLDGRTLNIFGNTTWTGTGNIVFNSGQIRNQPSGFFDIQTDADLVDSDGAATVATLINDGTLYKTDGAFGSDATNFSGVVFTDRGPTAVLVGELRIAGNSTASSISFDIQPGAQLTIAANFAFSGNSQIANSGTLLIDTGGTLSSSGSLALGGTLELRSDGTLTASSGTLSIDGNADWLSGTINGAATLKISESGSLNISGKATRELTLDLVNEGTLLVDSAVLTFAGFIQNSGTTILNDGYLDRTGTFQFHGGTVTGVGVIDGGVENSGATIQPGGPGAAGTIAIWGDYAQTAGTIEIEVGGATPGTQFDQLTVTGTASFAGTLKASYLNNFIPAIGQTFAVIPYASQNGVFTSIDLPPGLSAAALATAFTLTGTAQPNVVSTDLDVVDANDNLTSLREAILYANSHPGFDTISFNIPSPGVHTLNLTTALPALTETATINGYSQPGASPNTQPTGDNAVLQIHLHNTGAIVSGLQVSAAAVTIRGLAVTNFQTGIDLDSADSAVVGGNFIGVGPSGTASGNITGIHIDGSTNAIIGGTTLADRNIISANQNYGILISGSAATHNTVLGNFIGSDTSRSLPLGNTTGISFETGANGNTIGGTAPGSGNLIAFNQTGIAVDASSRGEQILGNTIQANVTAQIDLGGDGPTPNDGGTPPDTDTGANDLQNFPVITAAFSDNIFLHLRGTLASTPNTTFRLEFFEKSASGAGGVLLPTLFAFQTVITDAQGAATFDFISSPTANVGDQIVATATASDATGAGTSEFAPPARITDIVPQISLGNAIVVEGSTGTTALVFHLTLDHAQPDVPVTVNFATSDFTAQAGSDYTAKSGTVTFAPGATQQTITIDVTADTLAEFRERFHLTLSDPTYATLGDSAVFGIIQDDDHHFLAAGSGHGGTLSIFQATPTSAASTTSLKPFGNAFKGGVRVAVGDINGDGTDDFVAAAGSGKNGHVRVYDGTTLLPFADTAHAAFADLSAFPGYKGGVFVAVGDVNGDSFGDLIVSTGSGRSNLVKVFSGADASLFTSFKAFPGNVGGVRVATGDLNGDGYADLVTASGKNSAVKTFDIHDQPVTPVALQTFNRIFPASYHSGVSIATGDLADATHLGAFDGTDDLIIGAGAGRPNVRIIPSLSTASAQTILAYARPFHGVRVATADVNGDGIADLLAAQGTQGRNRISALSGLDFTKLYDFTSTPKSTDGLYIA